jgi:hypothetical protein
VFLRGGWGYINGIASPFIFGLLKIIAIEHPLDYGFWQGLKFWLKVVIFWEINCITFPFVGSF